MLQPLESDDRFTTRRRNLYLEYTDNVVVGSDVNRYFRDIPVWDWITCFTGCNPGQRGYRDCQRAGKGMRANALLKSFDFLTLFLSLFYQLRM